MSQVKSTILHKRLMKSLQHIESLGLVKASNCDKITSQFSSLKSDVESHPGDLQVMFPEKRLDEFYFKTMKVGIRYPELSVVLKIILTLSHGQADVERVFSLNKGTLQTSIGENSIVSKRLVKDHMLTNGLKPHEMDFPQDFMASCRKARNRYHEYLEENQKKKTKEKQETLGHLNV